MDKPKDELRTAVIVLVAVDGDKVQIAAEVTSDSVGKVRADAPKSVQAWVTERV